MRILWGSRISHRKLKISVSHDVVDYDVVILASEPDNVKMSALFRRRGQKLVNLVKFANR